MDMALGKSLGTVQEVKVDGTIIRIRVTIDVTKPLHRNIPTVREDSSTLLFDVKYERLPEFCYNVLD